MNRCSQSTTAAGDSIAGASSGRATATASAPIASTLAASIPVRMPPDATIGTSGSVCRTLQQCLRGRDAPLGQRRVADLAVPHELLDPRPRRATRACDVDGRDRAVDQLRGGRRTDAVADLFQHHRIADRTRDVAQPRDGAGEVGVTLVLHRLLQRIGMHRKGIGADAVERLDEIGHHDLVELRQPDVPDQQHVGRHVADAERRSRPSRCRA